MNVYLDPLDGDDTDLLLAALMPDTPAEVRASLRDRSGGNPSSGHSSSSRRTQPASKCPQARAPVATAAPAPIEILGKLVKPFALTVRLFGNMTAGHFVILSLMGLIFLFGGLPGWNWAIGFTSAALVLGIMLLELFVAFLQAYVFALLTAVFIGLMQHEH